MTATLVARRGRHRMIVAAALVTLMLTGCGSQPDGRSPATAPMPSAPAQSAQPGLPRSEPTTLDIPAIAVHSELVALGLNPDQTVRVPPVSTSGQAGWYEHGPTPGEVGPAVILGHVDGTNQPGVFYRLHELAAGAEIRVTRSDGGTAVFEVRRVQRVAKENFPTDAVYADTTGAELRLITCGGAFDRTTRHYLDNLIVYATMRN